MDRDFVLHYTIEEHIIPRFYLKNFSIDGKMIFQYNLKEELFYGAVPIKTLFKKRNIYEIKDDNGTFIERNRVENSLSKQEKQFSECIKNIENKVFDYKQERMHFLTTDETRLLKYMFSLQIYRFPKILKEVNAEIEQKIGKTKHSKKLPNYFSKDLTFVVCLAPKNDAKMALFPAILCCFLLFLPFAIGYAKDDVLITGDHPFNRKNNLQMKKSKQLNTGQYIYPLTSKMVLCFYPFKQKFFKRCNTAFELTENDIIDINTRIAQKSNIICSNFELSESFLASIKK